MSDSASSLKDRWQSAHLEGENAEYLESLYEAWLHNPASVPDHWQNYFSELPQVNAAARDVSHRVIREQFTGRSSSISNLSNDSEAVAHERKQVRVLQLINAYRYLGHRAAKVNPLDVDAPNRPVELSLAHHELTRDDLSLTFSTGSLVGPSAATLRDIIEICEQTYCDSVAAEYMHMTETKEKRWLQRYLEGNLGQANLSAGERVSLLQQLTAAETLERYLHTKYVGQKRFSLEGGESLIPMMNEIIQRAGDQGVSEIVIGMAHRGRLNVLMNVMGKSPQDMFSEFEGVLPDHKRTGDVKYHLGYSSDIRIKSTGERLHLALAFNPSHLEIIGPVVEGSVRARQMRCEDKYGERVFPIIIHGDAAFAGQGVVMETLNMSQTRGFSTKGTIHVVVNNQIGFTTSFGQDVRSTLYATDVAKMVNAPILHVNGDDPEAVMFVSRLALDYRMTFHKDVVIDLLCYRRQGHNEADEPAATQPMMYQRIHELETTRQLYANALSSEGVLHNKDVQELINDYRTRLDSGQSVREDLIDPGEVEPLFSVNWNGYLDHEWNEAVDTRVTLEQIQQWQARLQQLPEDFELHERIAKIYQARAQMALGEQGIDWGFAETLAYASLLDRGYNVRLSGQDSGRGTFFHRHAVLHNQKQRGAYIPLRKGFEDKADFLVIDSLLSEEAVLAFEYGYATAEPNTLTIWEAQFGDFANGAQVVIDQFISSGEQKWNRLCGLTLLLPHGYEGQGPEHSSARLERYMQLCAQHNLQICTPTTPAQIFHLLRRQMIRPYRKPLVVMSPKSLLRHKQAVSSLDELTGGEFKVVIDDPNVQPDQVTRLLLCGGKLYYDLLAHQQNNHHETTAVVRIEQLYPFPEEALLDVIQRYPNLMEVAWVQEEPLNQGAWYHSQHHIRHVLGQRFYLHHVTRPSAAAPAVGYARVHKEQQEFLAQQAFAEFN